MTEKHVLDYVSWEDLGYSQWATAFSIQQLAIGCENAVLVTGGFEVSEDVIDLANQVQTQSSELHATLLQSWPWSNKALSTNMQIKTDILAVKQVYRPAPYVRLSF